MSNAQEPGSPRLRLSVVSLAYSSWSMRAWLALQHSGAAFETDTAEFDMGRQTASASAIGAQPFDLQGRRRLGSVTGLFPVLWVGDTPIHEALAICEWVAEAYPPAGLWPDDPLARAQARAVCCEMASGFASIRGELSCHLFARVPGHTPSSATRTQIDRVFEIWQACLDRHGGPFLSGRFGVVDCMYYPVLSRFRTYGVALPPALEPWAGHLEASAPVRALVAAAGQAPAIPVYDDYIRQLGGDPTAARP